MHQRTRRLRVCDIPPIFSFADFKYRIPLVRDPPELVILGPRNSGKTTLLAQLTGLALPEDEPTNCPVMYTMTNAPDIGDAEWTCQLTLVRHNRPALCAV